MSFMWFIDTLPPTVINKDMCDHTLSMLANHQIRHVTWAVSLVIAAGCCVGMWSRALMYPCIIYSRARGHVWRSATTQ